ncbi:MAG: BufA2 family periplasmic bufferin-type metallophore [Candidatus Binataceae bacterium]
MNKSHLAGAVLATAIGLMFAAQPTLAADSSGGSSASSAQVKCIAGNSCKGQSSCQSANNSCKGQNSCKGKGWVMTANAKECEAQGGHAEQGKL